MLRALLRAFARPTRVYWLDGAAFSMWWLAQARKIGASMDALARGLR